LLDFPQTALAVDTIKSLENYNTNVSRVGRKLEGQSEKIKS